MTSVQIQSLLQGSNRTNSVDCAIKVLNTSFPSLQFVNSGSALSDVLDQTRATSEAYNTQVRLQPDPRLPNSQIFSLEQLVTSQQNGDILIRDTRRKAKEQLTAARELSLFRHSLSDELVSLTEELESSAASDTDGLTLLEEIETLHRNLKELESVKGYVQVILRALQLSEQVINNVERTSSATPISEASLADYVLLQKLVQSIQRACEDAKSGTGQDIKLVSFLADLVDTTWSRVREIFSSFSGSTLREKAFANVDDRALLSAAEGLRWPMPVDYASAKTEVRRTFENVFANLLKLQEIGERLNIDQDKSKPSKQGIYPLQALVRPISQRFKYHFEGTRQTNRLDKPEWYFAHILNVSHEHRPFLELVVQRLLQMSKYSSINAWREFTRLLLPILGRKIRRSMPTLLPRPALLAHTVYQALAFDDALREAGFNFKGTQEESKAPAEWQGTSDIILGNKDWFDAWLEGERKFSEDQYNEIISSPDAWHFSDDLDEASSNDTEVQPTNSARRVKALIEQITDRYKALPKFRHKTRFLTVVQVRILELYHTRISESLDSFESLSAFLIRAVPGALSVQPSRGRDGNSATSGVEGTRRLVKAYVSTNWMAHVMSTWGEDLFFLELWQQIREEASLRNRVKDVDGSLDPGAAKDEGTIFDELVSQYNKLAERAEDMLVRQITGEVEADLKAHLFRHSDVTSETEDTLESQALRGPVTRLSAHLSFLAKRLPAPMAITLCRRISGHVANHILDRQVLYRGRSRMSSTAGRAVLGEANLWVEASRVAMIPSGLRRVEGPWERLLEAGRLLSLEGEAFQQTVNAVRLGDDKQYEVISEAIGITEMSTSDVLTVLSAREDFPV